MGREPIQDELNTFGEKRLRQETTRFQQAGTFDGKLQGEAMKPAIGYIRVSTARQGRSGLGLEAQQAALAKFCDAEAFKLVETYTDRERR
jgi:Resolvase, N terminal domain